MSSHIFNISPNKACNSRSVYGLAVIKRWFNSHNAYVVHNKDLPSPYMKLPREKKLVAVKDNICTFEPSKNQRTSCSSKMLSNFEAPYEATVISLLKESGHSIMPLKTNMDEFGMGSSTMHSFYGPSVNPIDPERVAGGSSGGSAISVAQGDVLFALGSDTGGSVRLPAAYCGVYGFKPSYGLISRHGLVSYASSLDCVGVIAREPRVISEALSVLACKSDSNDPASLNERRRKRVFDLKASSENMQSSDKPLQGLRVGVSSDFIPEEMCSDAESQLVFEALQHYGERFEALGADIVKADEMKWLRYSLPVYYIIASAEASSNLSRYDGLRYGYSTPVTEHHEEDAIIKTRTEGFGDEVKRRILSGTFVLSHESFQEYFTQAQKIRKLIQEDISQCFRNPSILDECFDHQTDGVDLLLTPTCMKPAPRRNASNATAPLSEYVNDVFTVPPSLAGLPALSIPYKTSMVGVQLIGQYGYDFPLLNAAATLFETPHGTRL